MISAICESFYLKKVPSTSNISDFEEKEIQTFFSKRRTVSNDHNLSHPIQCHYVSFASKPTPYFMTNSLSCSYTLVARDIVIMRN